MMHIGELSTSQLERERARRWHTSTLAPEQLTATIDDMVKSCDSKYGGTCTTAVLEDVLQIVDALISSDSGMRFGRFSRISSMRHAEKLFYLIGFAPGQELKAAYAGVNEHDRRPYMFEEQFVLHDRPSRATLHHVRDELRTALSGKFDPVASKPRLVARLENLSYEQLLDQLARAAIRDSGTLARVEMELSTLDTPPWGELPEPLVREIALHLQGGRALAWCATCRAFRAAQPPLRSLFITTDPSEAETVLDGNSELGNSEHSNLQLGIR